MRLSSLSRARWFCHGETVEPLRHPCRPRRRETRTCSHTAFAPRWPINMQDRHLFGAQDNRGGIADRGLSAVMDICLAQGGNAATLKLYRVEMRR